MKREMVWSVPEGGAAILSFPSPLSTASIDELEECCALLFVGLRRARVAIDRAEAAKIEYDSWFAPNPGSGA